MKSIRTLTASLAALASGFAFAQAAPAPAPAPMPDIAKILAQTLSEKDIETLFGAMRDGMQGRQPDAQKAQALSQKLEGLASVLFKELMTTSLPMLDNAEGVLKEELRKLREQPPSGARR